MAARAGKVVLRTSVIVILMATIGHAWGDPGNAENNMTPDSQAIQAALTKYTVSSTLRHNAEHIPYGVLLRGAYRAVAGEPVSGQPPAQGGPPRIMEGEAGNDGFHSQRAVDRLHDACRLISERPEATDADIAHIARLFMLSEDQEYEDMAAHYEKLVDELPPPQKQEIQAIVDGSHHEARVDLSLSRVDWMSMAQDEPEIVHFLIARSCTRLAYQPEWQ